MLRAMSADHIGILGYDSFHFVVENLERSRKFYTEKFDFKEVARAGDELTAAQRAAVGRLRRGRRARLRVDAARRRARRPRASSGATPRA